MCFRFRLLQIEKQIANSSTLMLLFWLNVVVIFISLSETVHQGPLDIGDHKLIFMMKINKTEMKKNLKLKFKRLFNQQIHLQ